MATDSRGFYYMSFAEYADYEARVKKFFEEEGIQNLSQDESRGDNGEGYCSSHGCDCCGNRLQQTLYDASGYNPTTQEIQEYQVCGDCLYYAEYGQLDDMTMADMKD